MPVQEDYPPPQLSYKELREEESPHEEVYNEVVEDEKKKEEVDTSKEAFPEHLGKTYRMKLKVIRGQMHESMFFITDLKHGCPIKLSWGSIYENIIEQLIKKNILYVANLCACVKCTYII